VAAVALVGTLHSDTPPVNKISMLDSGKSAAATRNLTLLHGHTRVL